MVEVTNFQTYHSAGDVIAIILCATLFVIMNSSYTARQRNVHRFHLSVGALILGCASSIAYYTVLERVADGYTALVLLRAVMYLAFGVVLAMFNPYLMDLVDMEKRHSGIFKQVIWLGYLLYAITVILSPYLKLGFYLDRKGVLHQNYYKEPFPYLYLFTVVVMLIILAMYRKRLLTKTRICIYCIMVLSVGVVLLQIYLRVTTYTSFAMILPMMTVVYLFHYNGFDADTGCLDYKAYKAYINDMKQTEYYIVSMHLREMTQEQKDLLKEQFLHFCEPFFRSYCTFRIGDDRSLLICRKKQNRNIAQQMDKAMQAFGLLHEAYDIDYKIVWLESNPKITNGRKYLDLLEYVEESGMEYNTMKQATEEEMDVFIQIDDIYHEIMDIKDSNNLDDERVLVYCQPVWNTEKSCFNTAEALMRLNLPGYGMVYPDVFIPIAERKDLIHALSKIILHKTCIFIKETLAAGHEIERISVNFSIIELREKNFCEDVIQIIGDTGIPYDKIAIELTESRNEEDFELVKSVMLRLREYGIKFYLDDFGTGYSNMERIMGLPIDIIKFDRSLTELAGRDDSSRYMVGSFSDIFGKSNYQVLFEGVEDETDESVCKDMQAMYLQGYHYSKPIPIEKLTDFLS